MANVVKLTASDGSTVEFYDEIKAQGGVKDVYFSTDKTYVVAFYRKPTNANDKARLENIVGVYREKIFIQNSDGGYWHDIFAWPTKMVEWKGLTGIVIPFYNKKFFFTGVDRTANGFLRQNSLTNLFLLTKKVLSCHACICVLKLHVAFAAYMPQDWLIPIFHTTMYSSTHFRVQLV